MEGKVFCSGFKPSQIDGSEHLYEVETGKTLPKSYSYRRFLPGVIDQGQDPICVPCSVSTYLNWHKNLENGSRRDNKVNLFEIYRSKTTEGDGMTFKDAFRYLRHHGVESGNGLMKIGTYAMVVSIVQLQNAIVENGPCVGALPVYNYSDEFWKRHHGDINMGYHAISIVGYNSEGFIIRNSWGPMFANGGYTLLKYEDFGSLIETWTVIE